MMFHAMYDLPLTDAGIAAVDQLEERLRGGDEGAKDSFRALQMDLAAGIRAGKIDTTKMQAHYAAIDRAMQARQDQEADALNGLHAGLDASLRQSLVTLVRARRAAHAMRPPDAPGAEAADWTGERLDRLTDGLGLSAGQQKQVAVLLARGSLPSAASLKGQQDAANERVSALLRGFEQDDFDGKKFDLRFGIGQSPHDLVEREAVFLAQLLPILKADQREALAAGRERPGRGRPGSMDEPSLGAPLEGEDHGTSER
jgi:hypothetical protein